MTQRKKSDDKNLEVTENVGEVPVTSGTGLPDESIEGEDSADVVLEGDVSDGDLAEDSGDGLDEAPVDDLVSEELALSMETDDGAGAGSAFADLHTDGSSEGPDTSGPGEIDSDDDFAAGDDDEVDEGDESDEAVIPPPNIAQIVSGRHVRVAAEVKSWSSRNSVEGDPYVEALVSAIEAGDNLTAFATTNPFDLLPEPEPKRGRFLQRIARVLTIVRNMLVFAPVLLTWLAISRATEGFGRYSEAVRAAQVEVSSQGEDAPDRALNFLQFWESGGSDPALPGFEPLDEFWRITDVATLDALLIAVIIAFTLLANTLESRASGRRAKHARTIERERTRIAVSIMQGLQGSRSIDSETLEETLAVSLSSLSEAARDVNQAAARLEGASVGLGALTPRLADLSDEVSRLSSHFSTDVQQSINSLTNAVATLGSSLEGDLQRFMADVLTGLEEVVDRLKSTSVGVEYGTKQLRDDLDAIHQRLARVAGAP